MRLTAQEVYDKLVNEDGILQLEGQIKFYLGDVNIIVKQRDVVGNIMQELYHRRAESFDRIYTTSDTSSGK